MCKKTRQILAMQKLYFILLATVMSYFSLNAQKPTWSSWSDKTGAREMPSPKKIYWVNDFGGIKGGGIVTFKPGNYMTGAVFIKSNVELRIGKDVVLLGSTSFDDYPEIDTRIAGIEMKWPAALINMVDVKKASLTGTGTINARGKFCWDKYWKMRKEEYEPKGLRWIVDYDAKRVRTVLVQNSSDITIKQITLKNAGFWTVQLLYSSHLTVDGIVIRNNEDGKGPSTDGIDVDSSSWVLIQNCDIDCNDDDFCLKAGRDWDGLRVNRPTEYVLIRNSIARKGGGLLTLGSETSGGIRHVVAMNLQGKGTGNGFHIKSAVTRGGVVEDVWFINNSLDSVGNAFHFTKNWNPSYSYSTLPKGYDANTIPSHWKVMLQKVDSAAGIPVFRDIHVESITGKGVKKIISAEGLKGAPLSGFHFKDLNLEGATKGEIKFAEDWDFVNCLFTAKDNKEFELKNATVKQ